MARGLRLGIMYSTNKRRRNSNYYYEYDEDDDELSIKMDQGEEQMDRSRKRKHNKMVDDKEGRLIRKGDRVNLSRILFTKNRDFLITYNDRRVQARHLEGKFILLLFVPLLPWIEGFKLFVKSLAEVYAAIHPKGCFEIVFIGVKVDPTSVFNSKLLPNHPLEDLFEETFSIMPWTAIPFSDIKSPEFIETRWGFPLSCYIHNYATVSIVIDPTGLVLQFPAETFLMYGAPGFPFSDQKIEWLKSRDKKLLKHPNITKLLSSPGCNYVINKDKQEVPVHNLEDKVVALYFYENFPIDNATKYIQKVYEQVADKEKFEVVLVYVHDGVCTYKRASEESFWESFSKMPWLALPFKDPRCSSLQRIFDYTTDFDSSDDPDQRLVIIGPQGKFFDRYGLEILKMHGPKAYPFTCQRVAELAAEFVKKVTLDKFWGPNTYFEQNDGSKIKMSQLVGKRIILISDQYGFASWHYDFFQWLKSRYIRRKGTDDEFEVISIISNGKETVPWLTHPPFSAKSKQVKLVTRIFNQAVGLLAFDGDGRVVRSTTNPTIERGNKVFPFYAGGLEKELLEVTVDRFEQGHDHFFVKGDRWASSVV